MSTRVTGKSAQSKATYWRYHIDNCRRCSLSQAQYCRDHSLALSTFQYWKKKLTPAGLQEKTRFYPLTVQTAQQPQKQSSSSAGLTIRFDKDEVRVDLADEFSAAALKKLITVLKQL